MGNTDSIVNPILDVLPGSRNVIDGFVSVTQRALDGIVQAPKKIIDTVIDGITKVPEKISTFTQQVLDGAIDTSKKITNSIATNIDTLSLSAKNAISNVGRGVGDGLNDIGKGGSAIAFGWSTPLMILGGIVVIGIMVSK
jgi:phage-related protein